MWRRMKGLYKQRPPPPPSHPAPQEEAQRLALEFAQRSSSLQLPPETQQEQQRRAPERAALVETACRSPSVTDEPFTSAELEAVLQPKPDTAPGRDRITYSMLRHLGPVGRRALLTLFNESLASGSPPACWKDATIVPIPKAGQPKALRPISLLSVPGKLLERMVLNRLRWKVGELPPHLHAFQRRRSTTSSFMTLMGALRSRSGLVAFVDLEKAFELAQPLVILEALVERGVGGRLLCWLRGFLMGRIARVRFQGTLSEPHEHELGTPQGSCLSPFLFNLLIAKLLAEPFSGAVKAFCYADDLFIPRRLHA